MFHQIGRIVLAAICFISFCNLMASGQAPKLETRCGWYANPTPANHSLFDKSGEWIIGIQGGYQLEDFNAPLFKKNQWVLTNTGDYGYGCACFRMRVDQETHHVLEIKSASARALSVCRNDKALRKWKIDEN